jgi:hypothetical protein
MRTGALWLLRAPLDGVRRRIEKIEAEMEALHLRMACGPEGDALENFEGFLLELVECGDGRRYVRGWVRANLMRMAAEDLAREDWDGRDVSRDLVNLRRLAVQYGICQRVLARREQRAYQGERRVA